MTWRLCWEHTTMLVEEAHGGCDHDLAEISRAEAEQIAAWLAAHYWPSAAARLPWVAAAYPAAALRGARAPGSTRASCTDNTGNSTYSARGAGTI